MNTLTTNVFINVNKNPIDLSIEYKKDLLKDKITVCGLKTFDEIDKEYEKENSNDVSMQIQTDNVQNKDLKSPSIFKVISIGNFKIARKLIETGCNIDEVDENEKSPLHLAVSSGHFEITKLLIEKGVKVDRVDKDKKTPLHLAAISGHFEIAKLLIENGANVGGLKGYISNPLLNAPIHAATFAGHLEIAKLLIEKGAKINEPGKFKYTPLHLAAFSGHFEVAKLLIENGANVDDIDEDEKSSLQSAALNGHYKIIELLIENGAEVDRIDNEKKTALYLAAMYGHFEIAKLLIEKGANVNGIKGCINTPIHAAACAGHFEITKLLIEKGANVDKAGINGLTPLFYLYDIENRKKMANLLIDNGADVQYVKELRWRKWLAGGISFEGTTIINNNQVNLAGGFHPDKLVAIFEDFASSYQGRNRDWLVSLKPQFQRVTSEDSSQEILTKFATKQPLHFHVIAKTDFHNSHAIGVHYIGDYLLISNRGLKALPAQFGRVQPILVKRLDRTKAVQNQTMNLTTIKLLKTKADLSFFYDELPRLSGAIEDDFICNIFKSITQQGQKVGNCWWVSPKSMIYGVIVMSKLLSMRSEGMTEEEIKRHAGMALAETRQIYKEFSKFSKIYLFKEYLTVKMQEKESNGDLMISPDIALLSQIYKKLITKYPEEKQTLLYSIQSFENKFNLQVIPNECQHSKLDSSELIHSDSGYTHSDMDSGFTRSDDDWDWGFTDEYSEINHSDKDV